MQPGLRLVARVEESDGILSQWDISVGSYLELEVGDQGGSDGVLRATWEAARWWRRAKKASL